MGDALTTKNTMEVTVKDVDDFGPDDEEIVLAATSGKVLLRREDGKFFLGVSKNSNLNDEIMSDSIVPLTELQIRRIVEFLPSGDHE